ncbi:MAG: DUF924 domain-containing protein [Hyphomicrobiaceae bacterium]|nr:MAG: DUF924 domain-containing protein [Hyphomicrobiaceae bacterium]
MPRDRCNEWAADIHRFWFEELRSEQWFRKDAALDDTIRVRFLGHHEYAAGAHISDLMLDGQATVAAVIALDQFPRNMFRGTPRAFATDAKAIALAQAAIDAKLDATLNKNERLFLYLPFEHCEDAAAQARSVALFAALEDPELLKYAQAHKAIIDRFGRFPHRNAVLGRPSTREEVEFLNGPNSSF